MNENKIISLLLDQGAELKSIKEYVESSVLTRAEFLESQDKVMKKLNRLEEGQMGSIARDDRIEVRMEQQESAIQNIKTQLKLA